jgi:hypothetical protein
MMIIDLQMYFDHVQHSQNHHPKRQHFEIDDHLYQHKISSYIKNCCSSWCIGERLIL